MSNTIKTLEVKSLSSQWELKEQHPQFVTLPTTFPLAAPVLGLIPDFPLLGTVPGSSSGEILFTLNLPLTAPWEGHHKQGIQNSWGSEGAQKAGI